MLFQLAGKFAKLVADRVGGVGHVAAQRREVTQLGKQLVHAQRLKG